MSFPLYPNTTAGLAAIGPVQAMSDRNEAQTYMANGGQMFASGGITSYAEGGLNALPKYKYDPVTQKYVLVDEEDSTKAKAGLENLAARSGSGGSDSANTGVTARQAAVFDFMNTPAGQSYKDAFGRANSSVLGVLAPGGIFTGALNRLENPFTAYAAAEQAAFADRIGRLGTGYEGVGGPGIYSLTGGGGNTMTEQQTQDAIRGTGGGPLSGDAWNNDYGTTGFGAASGIGVGSAEGINSMDAASDAAAAASNSFESAYGYAHGGIAALARGGQSHLGDYSDGGRLLRGPGDGVSDSIPATIGDKRPARLADGEFVVPARIVSELGNGSTEAGARKLYAMMDRIQKARSKTVGKDRVAVNSRAEKNLPA